MLSYTEALQIILDSTQRTLAIETVPLVLALDRVLAEPIISNENIPAAANSAMDGYAIHAEDVANASVESPSSLRIVGESSAGHVFDGSVGRGDAVRIMTGGIVPDGANAVVEVEATSEADGIVQARKAVAIGASIRVAGEDIQSGAEAITSGKRIGPGDIGVMASLGVTNVPVRVKPNIGILSTGNEVIEAHRTPTLGQVRNSSAAALYAYCHKVGAEPIDLGIVGDDRDALRDALEGGLRFDILLTTGGVSAGAYDYVQHILPELGVDVKFHKTNIKPGRPMLFGTFDEGGEQSLVFGLPGNPVSSIVTFREYVAPAIAKLLGQTTRAPRLRARLTESIVNRDGKRHFVRGVLGNDEDGGLTVKKTGTQSSGAMTSMSRADCIIIIDETIRQLEVGELVDVELL